MKLGQRIVSLLAAAVTAVSALSVTAFATDPIGTNPTVLKDGVQATEQIKYDDSRNYDNGHNYADFSFTAPADGVMIVTHDAAISDSKIAVYRKDNGQQLSVSSYKVTSGIYIGSDKFYSWNDVTGIASRTAEYEVEAGEYLIRISRYFGYFDTFGRDGNGRVHITAEMKKPDAPSSIKVSEKTENSFTLTWAEPDEADAYDIRYKASSAKTWTTVEDIKDNTATISKLKANTKYTYCIRSKAGDIIGEWSKAATVTTDDPKNVKIAAPTVSNAKLTVEISWKAVKNATGYNVKYSTDKKNWKTVSVTETSCSIPVTAGKTYYYAVQGKNSAKSGTWSATKSIKVG